jgi:hypothetical protein
VSAGGTLSTRLRKPLYLHKKYSTQPFGLGLGLGHTTSTHWRDTCTLDRYLERCPHTHTPHGSWGVVGWCSGVSRPWGTRPRPASHPSCNAPLLATTASTGSPPPPAAAPLSPGPLAPGPPLHPDDPGPTSGDTATRRPWGDWADRSPAASIAPSVDPGPSPWLPARGGGAASTDPATEPRLGARARDRPSPGDPPGSTTRVRVWEEVLVAGAAGAGRPAPSRSWGWWGCTRARRHLYRRMTYQAVISSRADPTMGTRDATTLTCSAFNRVPAHTRRG